MKNPSLKVGYFSKIAEIFNTAQTVFQCFHYLLQIFALQYVMSFQSGWVDGTYVFFFLYTLLK